MRLLFLIFIFAQSLFFFDQQALASTAHEVQFKDITITTSSTHLLLFGIVTNHQTGDMEKALHSGIPMKFSFFVNLSRTRDNWPDEELVSIAFTHTLRYDTLKEQYQVELEDKKNKTSSFPTFSEALVLLNEINGLKVIELNQLLPDNSYELRIKAELYEKTLPMNLHYMIPFVSFWDIATDWYTIEFTY